MGHSRLEPLSPAENRRIVRIPEDMENDSSRRFLIILLRKDSSWNFDIQDPVDLDLVEKDFMGGIGRT